MSRIALAALVLPLALLAGCANDDRGLWRDGRMNLIGSAEAQQPAEEEAHRPAPPAPRRATPASKVLSAIALERVTGRKPDPSRLLQVD